MISEICPKEKCTGCGLCENICPKGAVNKKISDGFYAPSITEKCVECGLCQAACIANSNVEKNKTPNVSYAAWCINDSIHYESSSGGLAYKIAFDFIAGGGAVAGVWVNPDTRIVEHKIYRNTDELVLMRGSRYVQSYKGSIYSDLRNELEYRDVLFIGVPCEVFAVKQYFKIQQSTDDHKLFCIDILCHGGLLHSV